MTAVEPQTTQPDLSLVMPCYNEEGIVSYTISQLAEAFAERGHRLEIVAVDNGSTDRTGQILAKLATEHPGVVPHRVDVNQGYGHGLLSGIPIASGCWVGFIPADGQVDSGDVVQLFEAALASDGQVLAKVRRRFRMDGPIRKLVSIAYNLFFRVLWPRMASLDINGSPKIVLRENLVAMDLESRGWFLDPEMMIKAHYMGLRILEFSVFARMRGTGLSHVRAITCWEFFRKLVAVKFLGTSGSWRQNLASTRTNPEDSIAAGL